MTRAELVAALRRRGIVVRVENISDDIHDGYLPTIASFATSGLSDAELISRATRLYRLRVRGARGDALRLLLFLRDGWGWQHVQPTCVTGLEKMVRVTQTGARDVSRNASFEALDDLADDAADRQQRLISKNLSPDAAAKIRVQEKTMRFIWGLGIHGQPLPKGSLATLAPIMRFFDPALDEPASQEAVSWVEMVLVASGLTHEAMIEVVKTADAEIAKLAAHEIARWLQTNVRRAIRAAAVREGRRSAKTNPLTFFGYAKEMQKAELPQRITPAQFLGGVVASGIILAQVPARVISRFIEATLASDANTNMLD